CRLRLLAEAVAAVDGPVAAGQKRHLCLLAALGAGYRVHFALPATVAATAVSAVTVPATVASAGTAVGAATGTALRLVRVALFGVVLLVFAAKRERSAAVLTGKCLVLIAYG